jgi:thioredoxin-like negative regulator of GroEL
MERDRIRVTIIDVDYKEELAVLFRVVAVPTLVLVKEKRVVARLEGRASAPRIERMLEPHLGAELAAA